MADREDNRGRGRPRGPRRNSNTRDNRRNTDKKGIIGNITGVFKRPQNVPDDAWGIISNVLNESLRENARARRWQTFFRFAYLIVIVVALSTFLFVKSGNFLLDIAKGGDANKNHVAMIAIQGPVAGESASGKSPSVNYKSVKQALVKAFENDKAKAVVLAVNSPGGNPVTASYIFNEISKLRAENPNKKVYAIIRDIGTSAAYQISSAADEIYSHPSSLVGSIGVIFARFGYDELLDEYDVDYRVYTAGRNKAMLNPFLPRNPEHEAQLLHVLDTTHRYFIEDVIAGRGKRLDQSNPDVFSGMAFSSTQALEIGLIDGIGFFDEIVKEKTGLDNIVDYSVYSKSLFGSLPFSIGGNIGTGFANSIRNKFAPTNTYERY